MTRLRMLLPFLGLAAAVAAVPGPARAATSKYTNLDQALATARDLQKPVLIDFFAEW